MSPLDALLWAVAIIVGLIALAVVLSVIGFVAALIYGFSAWRKGEREDETEIFNGRADR